jgi:hypothetical protein
MLDADRYRPIQVTEVDERVYDDCGPCSFLMLAQAWTLGEVVHRPDGREMDKRELKRLRERLRNHLGPGSQTGGTTFEDARTYLAKEWPFLDLPGTRSDWAVIKAKLADGFVGVVNGNPVDCPPDSPLRRWLSGDDDYGHYVFADRLVEGKGVYVMDPLGGWRDGHYTDYDGEWVPTEHVRLYAAKRGFRTCLVRRGAMTLERRTYRAERERFDEAKAAWDAEKAALEAQLVPTAEAVAAEHERVIQAAVAAIQAL